MFVRPVIASVLVLMAGISAELWFPVDSTALLVAGLRRRFSCSAVALLYDGIQYNNSCQMQRYVTAVQKRLGDEHVPVTSLPLQHFTGRLPHSESYPLAVLIDSSTRTREYLTKLSAQATMSGPVWLLLQQSNSTSVEKFLDEVYVPFDCQLIVVSQAETGWLTLTEVYRVARKLSLKTQPFGRWNISRSTGYWITKALYRRRNNLDGFSFRVIAYMDTSDLEKCEKDVHMGTCKYAAEIWKILRLNMNCGKSIFVKGASRRPVSLVAQGKVDVAAGWYSITTLRKEIVDFTTPIHISKIEVFVGEVALREEQVRNYLKLFSRSTWLGLLALILIITCYTPLLYYVRWKYGCPNDNTESRRTWPNLFVVIGILCLKGGERSPSALCGRVVYLTWCITTFILMTSYSACMISILASQEPKLPFNNFEELLSLDGTYPLLMFRGSKFDALEGTNNALLQSIRSKLVLPYVNTTPRTDEGVLNLLCNSKRAYADTAEWALEIQRNNICNIVPVPDASFKETVGMLLPKGSPYKGIIDYNIQILRETGVAKRIYSSVWSNFRKLPSNSLVEVGLWNVSPLFLILISGICISALVLLLEIESRQPSQFFRRLFRGGKFKKEIRYCE